LRVSDAGGDGEKADGGGGERALQVHAIPFRERFTHHSGAHLV
jgi:hypothetical protein